MCAQVDQESVSVQCIVCQARLYKCSEADGECATAASETRQTSEIELPWPSSTVLYLSSHCNSAVVQLQLTEILLLEANHNHNQQVQCICNCTSHTSKLSTPFSPLYYLIQWLFTLSAFSPLLLASTNVRTATVCWLYFLLNCSGWN